MSPPVAVQATSSTTGRPAVNRVSKAMRHKLAGALATATGMSFGRARALIAQRAGDSRDDLEAWLWSTYRLDPTGVTAVRNVSRGGRSRS